MASIRKIAILGATGMTGRCALDEALASGLQVKLLLRDPSKLPSELHKNVEIVQGNAVNSEDVDKVVSGVDGVVVALGTRNQLEPTTEMSRGLANVVASMKKHNIKAISVCLSAFLFYEPEKVPQRMRDINEEHFRMLQILQSSRLNYVAIFPPHISDSPKGGFVVKNDARPNEVRVISKHDLGAFLVESLSKEEHYGHTVGIASVSS